MTLSRASNPCFQWISLSTILSNKKLTRMRTWGKSFKLIPTRKWSFSKSLVIKRKMCQAWNLCTWTVLFRMICYIVVPKAQVKMINGLWKKLDKKIRIKWSRINFKDSMECSLKVHKFGAKITISYKLKMMKSLNERNQILKRKTQAKLYRSTLNMKNFLIKTKIVKNCLQMKGCIMVYQESIQWVTL